MNKFLPNFAGMHSVFLWFPHSFVAQLFWDFLAPATRIQVTRANCEEALTL